MRPQNLRRRSGTCPRLLSSNGHDRAQPTSANSTGAVSCSSDASFQLNPGEKVGLVGPNGSGKTTVFRMIAGEEAPDAGELSIPKRTTVGYFRQDVEAMGGRPVLDEAIAGSGRLGDLHHELIDLDARDERSRAGGRDGERSSPASARSSTNTRSAAATSSRRAPARCFTGWVSTDRQIDGDVGRAFRRMEDARRDGQGAARQARRPSDGRADQPPRHRVDPLARALHQVTRARPSF